MDQHRIAGLGNLLVDEALWRAGIDPARLAVSVDAGERRLVHKAIRTMLRTLDRRGGSHTGDMPRTLDAPVSTRRLAAGARQGGRPHDVLVPRPPALTAGVNMRAMSASYLLVVVT